MKATANKIKNYDIPKKENIICGNMNKKKSFSQYQYSNNDNHDNNHINIIERTYVPIELTLHLVSERRYCHT